MSTQDIANDLVALCRQGKFDESGEKYWADDVVSIEAGGPPGMDPVSRGKDAVRGKGDVGNLPLHEIEVPAGGLRIAALLVAAGLMPSNSEANRKLKERAVRVDGAVFEDASRVFAPGFEGVIAVGKRNFARVRLLAG